MARKKVAKKKVARKSISKSSKPVEFKTGLQYPFNRPKGMLNALWVLFPIFGWLALGGYGVRITNEFLNGKFKQLPEMNFGSDFKLGFFMLVKAIPFLLAYIVFAAVLESINPSFEFIVVLTDLLIIPMLGINFIKKQTVSSFFEFGILDSVFRNFGDYIISLIKGFFLFIVFMLLVIILVGIPGMFFTKNLFLADFYRRNIK